MPRRRRRRRKTRRRTSTNKRNYSSYSRSRRTREGNHILSDTPDNNTAAHLLGEIYKDKDDVLDATDLNESFKYYNLKHK